MDDDIVPDSDPFAPFDLPSHMTWIIPPGYVFQQSCDPPTSPLTPLPDDDTIQCYSPAHDDVVPDSDPPYPAHIQMLLPCEPRRRTTTQFAGPASTVPAQQEQRTKGNDTGREIEVIGESGRSLNNRQYYHAEEMIENVESLCTFWPATPRDPSSVTGPVPAIPLLKEEEMVENLETLCTFSPARPPYQYDYDISVQSSYEREATDTIVAHRTYAPDRSGRRLISEEPTSDDEHEYRTAMQYEIDRELAMYGSVSPPGIPYGEHDMVNIAPIGKVDCANPTSEDERQYREMMEDEMLLAQPDFMHDISGMDEVGFREEPPLVSSPAEEQEDIRSSSVFEEAQRPPWLGCTIEFTGSGYDDARGSSESNDDEVIPATHPEWAESLGLLPHIQRRLEEY